MHANGKAWFEMQHTLRGPAWRYQLATEFANGQGRQACAVSDAAIREAVTFFELWRLGPQGQRRAERRYPHIGGAEELWANSTLRARVQLMLLADCEPSEIAGRLGIPPAVVQAVADLHFDVRGMLQATDWILTSVLLPEGDRGRDDLAAEMRLAYYGGRHAALALIDAKSQLPVDPAGQLYTASLLLHAKVQQALEVPLTAEQAPVFMKLYADVRSEDQRIQLEREKLSFRVQRWAQRLALAQARVDLERERLNLERDREPNSGRGTSSVANPATINSPKTTSSPAASGRMVAPSDQAA
ncbi:MAG TPA: hypothetical protein VHV55_09105 [Pirellulales bacterium]|jgi:hypothetical protein|nr:hypothetical protein [Pirellulales bacterium]